MVRFTEVLRRLAAARSEKAEGIGARLIEIASGAERRRRRTRRSRERATAGAAAEPEQTATEAAEAETGASSEESTRGRRGRRTRRRKTRNGKREAAAAPDTGAAAETEESPRDDGAIAIVEDVEPLEELIGGFETTGRVSVRRRGKDRTRSQRADALSYFAGGVASEDPEAGRKTAATAESESAEGVVWRKVGGTEGEPSAEEAKKTGGETRPAAGSEGSPESEADNGRRRRGRRGGRRRRKAAGEAAGAAAAEPAGETQAAAETPAPAAETQAAAATPAPAAETAGPEAAQGASPGNEPTPAPA
ncbi:MAG: hypothetical protein D6776_06085, partial [Planctomycetota bacterium]